MGTPLRSVSVGSGSMPWGGWPKQAGGVRESESEGLLGALCRAQAL